METLLRMLWNIMNNLFLLFYKVFFSATMDVLQICHVTFNFSNKEQQTTGRFNSIFSSYFMTQ